MKVLLILTIFLGAIFVAPALGNVVISGKAIDSLTSLPISGVNVEIATAACSTLTDTGGNFSLTVITTAIKVPEPKLIWSQEKGLSYFGSDKAQISLINLRGENIFSVASFLSGKKELPRGVYLIVIKDQGKTKVLKIMNVKPGLRITANNGSLPGLAKGLAGAYPVSFKKAGYNPATRTVTGSTANLVQKMARIAPTGSIRVNANVQKFGSLTNGPAAFSGKIEPNKLIVKIWQTGNGNNQPVTDTIRNFAAGEVFSKVYSGLPSGISYTVGSWTEDSAKSNTSANGYRIVENIRVNEGEISSANLNLLASYVHFSAKFAPVDSAVKFETYIKARDASYQPLPMWTDSLVVSKGKKDSSVITKNLELSNSTLSPYITHYDIRFRAYGDSGASHAKIVLYEGTDSNLAVSPGENVVYTVEMKPVMRAPVGSLCVNLAIQKIMSTANGPAVFTGKIEPNLLFINIWQTGNGNNQPVTDTIRNFAAGQVFSKVYPGLPSGIAYTVGAWTADSISGWGVNGYRIIENIAVNTSETDTANLSLLAGFTYFSAKFAPDDSAVKFETFIKALNASYYPLPTWTDSLVVSKGKKDSSVITKNLELCNASSPPYITNYSIRFRVYGDTGVTHQRIVLFEGTAANVAVSPGADQSYSVTMNPVNGVGLAKTIVGFIRE